MKRYVLALGIIIFCFVSADASSLFGKVIEVNSGDVITIFNLNRPVRVRLLGVDAPEMNQAFGDVAKKHLSDLVFEKSVLVEYTGIGADRSLTGRVLLNNADIGAQMIRDGVAWFDSSNGNRLSANDREIYQQSEQAARNEKRGLWKEDNPVAPWEFVKAEAMRRTPVAVVKENVPDAKPRRSGPVPELTNISLMAVGMNSASSQPSQPESNAWVGLSTRKNWSRFQPQSEDFSVEIPEEGEHLNTTIPIAGETIELRGYRVRDGWALYALSWFKAPTIGETDELAFKDLFKEFMDSAAEGYKIDNRSTDFKCKPPTGKNVSQNGYTGVDYDFSSCGVPLRVRMYTKVVNNERLMYIATAAYAEEDAENV